MYALFRSIPTTEGVRKVGPGEGEKLNIAGAHLTWTAEVSELVISANRGLQQKGVNHR
jgi:hypothetical protein